jgi:hypothetical protein
MSYDEIGLVLDVTPGAVAQLLSRARMALRRELRLQQVDPERMSPACRARLGDIGALIDGELNPDRAQVLARHLKGCDACRAARASFEEARVTYRAFPPLLALGLGADTARAAEGRGLVRFSRRAGRGPAGWLGARRRAATAVEAAGVPGAPVPAPPPGTDPAPGATAPPPPASTATPPRAGTGTVPPAVIVASDPGEPSVPEPPPTTTAARPPETTPPPPETERTPPTRTDGPPGSTGTTPQEPPRPRPPTTTAPPVVTIPPPRLPVID